MSNPNPRRAALRPNGQQHPSKNSAPSSPAPSYSQQHQHQQHRLQQPHQEESPEIRALRIKYGPKLDSLKEMFPDWADEDLLSLLSETNGNLETAATRIAEGQAEQWSVKSKKDKKPHIAGPSSNATGYARDRAESGGAASPGRGSGFRGGRGGGRGGSVAGRGGRGRGGTPMAPYGRSTSTPGPGANDAQAGSADTTAVADTTSSTVVSDGLPESAVKPHEDHAKKDAEPTVNGGPAQAAASSGDAEKPNGVGSSPVPSPAPAGAKPPTKVPSGSKFSWAQIVKPKVAPPVQPPPPVAPPIIHVPPPITLAESVPAAEEEPTTVADLSWEAEAAETTPSTAPVTQEPLPTQEPSTTAPGDDWITVTPPTKPSVDLPAIPAQLSTSDAAPAVATKTWTEISAPDAPVCYGAFPVEAQAPAPPKEPSPAPALAPTTTTAESVNAAQAAAPPPGLPSLPAPAPAPAVTAAPPAPTSRAPSAKPSTPRLSHRGASAKFKTDAPVVMPGGIGALGTSLGSLSFGSAVIGTGYDSPAPGIGRVGMQFGSLSLNDDLDSSAPSEPPAPEVEQPEPIVAPAPASPAPPPEPISKPEPSPPAPAPVVQAPVVESQPQPQAHPAQVAPQTNNLSGLSLYQQPQPVSQPQSLPHQVTSAPGPIPAQVQNLGSQTPTTLSFNSHQAPAPGLHLPQLQPSQASTLQSQPSHQSQQQQQQQQQAQHVQAANNGANHSASQLHQPQPQAQAQVPQQGTPQQHLSYAATHQLPPHLDASVASQQQQQQQQQQAHPATAAQSQYFRHDSSYFQTSTPPHSQSVAPQNQHQLSQSQDHTLAQSSPYGAFSPLGQGQTHLGGFGTSPGPTDYASYGDSRANFYDTYGQTSTFQNRSQLGHEDASKSGLPTSAQTAAGLGQQSTQLGQGQPPLTAAQQAQQQQQFPGMMPYYYQQPYYMPNQYYAQPNPYPPQPAYPKYPSYQPPHAPGVPPLQQQQGSKPPTSAGTPYTSQQSHAYLPAQTTSYEDPSAVGYQQTANPAADYGKQGPLYGQGMQNFFGGQNPVQSTAGSQLGVAGQQRGSTGASASPENPYKPYTTPGAVPDKQGQQQTGQGRGAVPGGPQLQGTYYGNRYSNAPQPAAQGYPQTDGQFYPSYQHQQPRQGYWQ